MKKNTKLILAVAAVAALIAILLGVWFATRPETTQGAKTITVEVVHKDGSTKTFTCHTNEEYLGPVLDAENIAQGEEGPYGLYIKFADGEKAVYEEDGERVYLSMNTAGICRAVTGGGETIPIEPGAPFILVREEAVEFYNENGEIVPCYNM